jgi:endonuclease YncB( thermonuclease family)
VVDRDGYGRLPRYVHDSGRDTGLGLIRRGLAKARYDGRDGYDRHPRQAKYRGPTGTIRTGAGEWRPHWPILL